ncbi:c-type cytochrome biogenesis protein CcmI [Pseudohoeflea coraliihabitans]|uniref:C-type cytochrome biogenesis protein CcmI n=1 Tax=Pseudohoeflea coraliihabitans TaxID=2860393 RepID=A0ABS6WRT6_9HYPH|nr:c-type cytochrome biogenesis protein CcmI [Pseudohoeflea sp. DP4N28-3]MBW3098677.1 c-type cytochrome biogenesis protein CcmI [Pseudohoeflea sp. DP4N28-3]
MLFWILAALLTFAAIAAVLWPLRGRRAAVSAPPPEAHDIEVYRDQLAEIERDRESGHLAPAQAETARAEIGRRLLTAARRDQPQPHGENGPSSPRRRNALARPVTLAIVLFIPLAALPAYLYLGSPGLSQQPLAARMNAAPEQTDIAVLVANAERHLKANPDDGRGWEVLAPIYLRTGRLDDAATAFRRAIALLGPSAGRQAGLGEALVSGSGGIVTEEAQLAFQSARELDPDDPRPAYFLALASAQEGRIDVSRAQFESLIRRSPENAPWLPTVRNQLAALEAVEGRGMNADALASALGAVTVEARDEMLASMLATLKTRLERQPEDLESWLMLVRSHAAMGERDEAQQALTRAGSTFPTGQPAIQLAELAAQLGLEAGARISGVTMIAPEPGAATPATGTAGTPVASGPFLLPDAGKQPPAAALGNPDAAAIASARDMTASDRAEMIRGMVASLDAKLTEAPDNLPGWLRLIRSYTVLGDRQSAAAALVRARAAFPQGDEARAAIDQLATELSLQASEESAQ